MKKILLSVLMFVPVILISQTQVPPGPVSGTWDQDGSPYMVNGEIFIEESETLIIEPGVDVKFTGWYKFIVYGSLMAEGTETDTILFTASDTNNRWHGIRFLQTNKTSVLDHCIIEYGMTDLNGTINTPENSGGGILCWQSPAASITIANSILRNNQAWGGGGLFCIGSGPLVSNCEIINNSSVRWGGGIDVAMNAGYEVTVNNCLVAYNNAGRSGGGISLSNTAQALIENNTIIYNTGSTHGGGMRIYYPYGFAITGNLIAYNQTFGNGGGIQFYGTSQVVSSLSDNTIVYNNSLEGGGGIWVNSDCTPSFTSDIIYFNEDNGSYNQVHLKSGSSQPLFNYCDVQDSIDGFTGPGAYYYIGDNYTNCIEEDPLFVDPPSNDFGLTWANYPEPDESMSPCIDKGCPGPFPEADGTCNDIGAYFFYQQLDTPVALPAGSITDTSFLAQWTSAYGALGYTLDVALDDAFTNMVYEGIDITGDTVYMVEGLEETVYYFRVNAYNTALTSDYSNTQIVNLITSIREKNISEDILVYPNPFSTHTTLSFRLEKPENVQFTVYNVQSQIVYTIQERRDKGEQEMRWNTEGMPSGMYYFRIQAGDKVGSGKMVKME